ncbi:ABC transporter permease [Vibrio tetraodonis]|uniref:ABC transporter permease n=1 Tax=Vibrio tetraodonis TaxID=2231647 RepID=UPI000E0A5A10|nr:ABC transporter permease [Vibrio tetraodonis]
MSYIVKRSQNPWFQVAQRLSRHKLAMLSLVFLCLLALVCFGANPIALWLGVDPYADDLFSRFSTPSDLNLLGTDELGRDIFTRLLLGGQVSLTFAFMAALTTSVIGTVLGVIAGYYGGRVDAFIMRSADFIISLPSIMLLILIQSVDMTKLGLSEELVRSDSFSIYRLVLVLSILGWPFAARLVRSNTLSVKHREYVQAAIGYGASHWFVMVRHIIPNVIAPVITATTLGVGGAILTESALSFLGFGINPPTPSWGNMLQNAREAMWLYPMAAVYPGLMVLMTVITINFLGDGLQEAIDPKS